MDCFAPKLPLHNMESKHLDRFQYLVKFVAVVLDRGTPILWSRLKVVQNYPSSR